MTNSAAVDIREAFELAGMAVETGPWGRLQSRINDDLTLRVSEDDGVFYITSLTGGRAELGAGQVRLDGSAATPTMLALVLQGLAS